MRWFTTWKKVRREESKVAGTDGFDVECLLEHWTLDLPVLPLHLGNEYGCAERPTMTKTPEARRDTLNQIEIEQGNQVKQHVQHSTAV